MRALLAAISCAMATALNPGVVLGLNGALQRRVAFDAPLAVGAVNRASESNTGVGGKGQGAFLAAKASGAAASLAMFYGGDTGDAMAAAIRAQCDSDEALWVATAFATRICTTLVSPGGDATEVVEPSGAVAASELDDLTSRLAACAPAAGVLVSGSVPPGVPGDSYYGSCVAAVAGAATKVLVDSVVGLEGTLDAARDAGCAVALKLNARELLALAGDPLAAGAADAVADPERAARAARRLAASLDPDRACLHFVLWTDGPHPAGAFEPASGATYALASPPLPGPVLSPIGAGDTVAGATFAAWLGNEADGDVPAAVAAFAFGLSRGAASCLTRENAAFDAATAEALLAGTEVTRA